MDTYKFHTDENLVKEVLTGKSYTPDVVIDAFRTYYIVANDFNTLDIQRKLFAYLNLEDKFNGIDRAWQIYNERYAKENEIPFKDFEEFIDCLNYCDFETKKIVKGGFGQNLAVTVKNNKEKVSNVIVEQIENCEQYLKKLCVSGDEKLFDEMLSVLDIDKEALNQNQLQSVEKFYKNTMEYGVKRGLEEKIKFLKLFAVFFNKVEDKITDKYLISVKELANLIQEYNPNLKIREVYDELTDKSYLIADIDGKSDSRTDKEIMQLCLTNKESLMFLGQSNDKINIITGRTYCSTEQPQYAFDINMMSLEYREFYAPFLNYFLNKRTICCEDYKYFVNDMLELGPIFVGVNDFDKFVNGDFMSVLNNDKIGTKTNMLLKSERRLDAFLKKEAHNYRNMIDKVFKNTVLHTREYSDLVKKHKPEEFIIFGDF